jgi:hypothetical protein
MMGDDFIRFGERVESLLNQFGDSGDNSGFWCNQKSMSVFDCIKKCRYSLTCGEKFKIRQKHFRREVDTGEFDWGLMALHNSHRGDWIDEVRRRPLITNGMEELDAE